MNAHLIRAISQAVEQLLELIEDDETPQPDPVEIHIIPDPHNKDTHLCVYAELPNLSAKKDSVYLTYPYHYAIYINRETYATECDGY